MSEKRPEFGMENPDLPIEEHLDQDPLVNEREQTMQRILSLVSSRQYAKAEELINDSGITYSDVIGHLRHPE